ncbi:MAG: DUF3617 family protein [Asticcacaulis sp.]
MIMTGRNPIIPTQQTGVALSLLVCLIALSGCHKKPAPPPTPEPEPVVVAKPSEPLPPRQPGLWQTEVTEEGSSEPPQVLKICIDAETDRHMGILGTDLSGDSCKTTTYNQGEAGWNVLAECVVGTGVMTEYSGSITGDVTKDYTLKVRSQTTGGNLDRVTSYTVTSKRIGACRSGQKPGDVLSGGIRMNLFEMSGLKSAKQSQSRQDDMPPPDVVD